MIIVAVDILVFEVKKEAALVSDSSEQEERKERKKRCRRRSQFALSLDVVERRAGCSVRRARSR